MQNLSKDAKISLALAYASGTTSRNGATLDMSGYESAMMIVTFGAIATGAAVTLKAQYSDDGTTFTDISGASYDITGSDDDKVYAFDIVSPKHRYLRVVVVKDSTNACAESAIYVQYNPRQAPTSQGAGVSVTTIVPAS